MKLHNKKTGEIRDGRIEVVFQNNDKFPNPLERHTVESIDELNEEWEEYEPAEPLIKDEKIRKAVRAWAEANEFEHLIYWFIEDYFSFMDGKSGFEIKFVSPIGMKGLKNDRNYTIAELCGEEEECES